MRRTRHPMESSETVVVIDDDKEIRVLVELAVAKAGRTVIGFGDGEEALRYLSGGVPVDLVISDVAMEGYDGHRLLRHLRSEPKTAPTPVLFVTEGEDSETSIGGLHDRGVGLIRKPFEIAALRVRVDEAVRRGPVPSVVRDRVTGLLSAEQFRGDLEAALRGAPGSVAPLAVVVGDLEDFGRADAAGAEDVLRRIGEIVSMQLRGTDLAARIGDVRFATLHRACDAAGATIIAERILGAVAEDSVCAGVRIAIGVAAVAEPNATDAEAVMRATDGALSRAKEHDAKKMAVAEV
jgi:diguanylate cyclase (GGDEF)-like protein